jgi:hypothetical protein
VTLARALGNHPTACTYAGALAWARFRLGEQAQGLFQMSEAAAEQARFDLREMLAHSLYLKALMHAEVGEEAQALESAEDAVALREEIGLRDLAALRARLLVLRLRARLAGRDAARAELAALAEQAQNEEERAFTLYSLWDVTRDTETLQAARPPVALALDRTSRCEYRDMLAAMDAS